MKTEAKLKVRARGTRQQGNRHPAMAKKGAQALSTSMNMRRVGSAAWGGAVTHRIDQSSATFPPNSVRPAELRGPSLSAARKGAGRRC